MSVFSTPEEQGLVFSESKKVLIGCTNKNITDVVIPAGVTEIGDFAFENCSSLTSVVLPDSVTEINKKAFVRAGCEKQVKRDYGHLFIK